MPELEKELEEYKSRLREAYTFVRRKLFWDWDENKEFRLEIDHDRAPVKFGYFNFDKRKIELSPYFFEEHEKVELYGLLVHEICHYFNPDKVDAHSPEFWECVRKTAERAKATEIPEMAHLLIKEANDFNQNSPEQIYRAIEEEVVETPEQPLREALYSVALAKGFIREKDLISKYPDCEKVYKTASANYPK